MPRLIFSLAFFLALAPTFVRGENWQDFRGPTGQGHYAGMKLPLEWTKTKNVVWQTTIPGKGWSSPIVQEGRVYLTSAVPIKDKKDLSLQSLCLDAGNGTILWQKEIFVQDEKAPRIHGKNSHASPSPLTDGRRLYVHFGHQGTAALDFEGNILWRNTDLKYAPVHGNGGSPILVEGKLVFAIDGADKQILVALDPASGKELWRADRHSKAGNKFSFGTPLAIQVAGKTQIISPASDVIIGCDASGKELWRVKYTGYSVIPRPVHGHGLIYMSTGYNTPSLLAIRVDGQGDVTSSHVAWTLAKGAPHTPSPLLVGEELYLVSDNGLASCVDARTGKPHWQERVEGNYSASPFHAHGHIYFQSESGTTTVVKAGKKFEQLAQSNLGERTFASPAAADGALYLRTESKLYRLQEK